MILDSHLLIVCWIHFQTQVKMYIILRDIFSSVYNLDNLYKNKIHELSNLLDKQYSNKYFDKNSKNKFK